MAMKRSEPSERAQLILKSLIDNYLSDGQPVGSKTLASSNRLGLSAATIRNVMAGLEAEGYICSPHTSAGRVPTAKGYRFFVDSLLVNQDLEKISPQELLRQIDLHADTKSLLQQASGMLSGLTRQVGLVKVPSLQKLILRHIEFLRLSDDQLLVILVLNERDVQNRIIKTNRGFTASELEQVSNYLNQEFAGEELHKAQQRLLDLLSSTKEAMEQHMQEAIDIASQALQSTSAQEEQMLVSGQSNLLQMAADSNLEKLQTLFDAFSQKRDILHLLDQCLQSPGVQVYIGEESGHHLLEECSVITAPYRVRGQTVGVLGVLGPTRMNYQRVIPLVDITARLLGCSLERD